MIAQSDRIAATMTAMSEAEARACVTAIVGHLTSARALLLDLYEREGWRALGYASWRECAAAEFGESERQLYRQLEAAQTEQVVCPNGQIGTIPESHLRPLTALRDDPDAQRAVWQEVIETAPSGRVTQAHVRAAVEHRIDPLKSSASVEWYTPELIIRRVVKALGGIDLDPCADPDRRIPAVAHLTEADDGLSREWQGRVYMNPPYGRGIVPWIRKLREEFDHGNVIAAIALVPARTDTEWWRVLADFPYCAVDGRLHFSGHANGATFPSAVIYLGADLDRFADAFGDLGTIYQPYRRTSAKGAAA